MFSLMWRPKAQCLHDNGHIIHGTGICTTKSSNVSVSFYGGTSICGGLGVMSIPVDQKPARTGSQMMSRYRPQTGRSPLGRETELDRIVFFHESIYSSRTRRSPTVGFVRDSITATSSICGEREPSFQGWFTGPIAKRAWARHLSRRSRIQLLRAYVLQSFTCRAIFIRPAISSETVR